MSVSKKRVALATLGCKVNQYETASLAGLFERAGYQVVDFEGAADVYVVNTCAVTAVSERKSRQLARRARRRNAGALVVVTGCYAQLAPAEIEKQLGVASGESGVERGHLLVIGTQNRQRIVELVERAMLERAAMVEVGDIGEATAFEDIPSDTGESARVRTRAVLKIQEGCRNFCSYCIIPHTRGRLRSRPLDSVRREASRLVGAGFKEIVLTGIHLGAYGRDFDDGTALADAVRAVLDAGGESLGRVRLGSLESNEVTPELLALMGADERVARHLHLPLQSGSDEILRAMNRPYTASRFAGVLAAVRRELPNVAITTDIIVGFPGESVSRFRESVAFIEQMGFSRMHVFPYSERPGTPAATMPNPVPQDERYERVRILRGVGERLASEYAATQLGTAERVLPETVDEKGVKAGHSGTYLKVYTDDAAVVPGEMATLRLTRLHRDGLWGEAVRN